ncbi:MAG: phytanoyl-CoA dioxygenase family protein [Planctomycetes bacterium]|nr:phytanoyl-CoA dioxygenase family protein [Planctomycetota bacterium]
MTNVIDHKWTGLTQQQASDFARDGFLHVPSALDQDMVQKLISAGDRLVASDLQQGRRDNGQSDGFRNFIALEPCVLDLLCNPLTLPLVVQIMGPSLQLHTSDLIWKYPDPIDSDDDCRIPGWHRDIQKMTRDIDYDSMPRFEIKVAYYLTDCPDESFGQTRVAAGSHRWRSEWQQKDGQIDPDSCRIPILKSGDALLFENRCLHAGGPNKSDQIRKTLMMGYSHNWMRPDDYDQQSPELLERCDPMQRCLIEQINSNFDELGRFRPCVRETPLETWAYEHGYTQPSCH